jgi:hypothetical protein
MEQKSFSFGKVMLGVGVVWIIPLSLGVIAFLLLSHPRFSFELWSFFCKYPAVFLDFAGITQLVYVVPLFLVFRKRKDWSIVRGIWVGAVTVLITNLFALIILYNGMEERARRGTTKGAIEQFESKTPGYYGNKQGSTPVITPGKTPDQKNLPGKL